MNILIHLRRTKGHLRVTSGKALTRIYTDAPAAIEKAVKRTAMKRRGPLHNPHQDYWPDDMKLLQISETCWQAEWPGEEQSAA